MSKWDRSVATGATLAATYRSSELDYHMTFANEIGVTRDELLALIT
jgi:alkylhydroperoxidase/carboxymuconolactone decarboxylase family protein YurZ